MMDGGLGVNSPHATKMMAGHKRYKARMWLNFMSFSLRTLRDVPAQSVAP